MEVLVNHLGDAQFEVKARGHVVYCDQPVSNGGFDEGMTPPEFMLASLGTCAVYYAVQYLNAHGLPKQELRVRVQAEKAAAPARLGEFRIEIEYGADLSEKDRAGILQSAKKCLIHNTLLHPPRINVDLKTARSGAEPIAA